MTTRGVIWKWTKHPDLADLSYLNYLKLNCDVILVKYLLICGNFTFLAHDSWQNSINEFNVADHTVKLTTAWAATCRTILVIERWSRRSSIIDFNTTEMSCTIRWSLVQLYTVQSGTVSHRSIYWLWLN